MSNHQQILLSVRLKVPDHIYQVLTKSIQFIIVYVKDLDSHIAPSIWERHYSHPFGSKSFKQMLAYSLVKRRETSYTFELFSGPIDNSKENRERSTMAPGQNWRFYCCFCDDIPQSPSYCIVWWRSFSRFRFGVSNGMELPEIAFSTADSGPGTTSCPSKLRELGVSNLRSIPR